MRVRRLAALPSLLLLLATAANAAPPGFAFLELPSGARAGALAGAYSSVAEGAEAVFWNPAGLEGVRGTQLSMHHTESIEHLRHEHFALAGHLFGGGVAASVRAMYSEPIEERDELGNLIGTFGAHDLEFALGYGAQVSSGVTFGFSGQYVRERIANQAAGTWAMNTGAAWRPASLPRLRLAASVHNIGPAAHYTIDGVAGRAVGLPMALQAGGTWRTGVASGMDLGSTLEVRTTRGRSGLLMLGEELSTPVGAALRAGVRVGDDVSALSFGAGWATGGFRLDYAFTPSRLDLDDTHRFSLAAQF